MRILKTDVDRHQAMISHKRLKELLHYDPETGVFTRLIRLSNFIHIGDVAGGNDGHGYWRITIYGIKYQASRLAWLYMKGVWPTFEIDHKDTNPSNNRWKNLRDVTHVVNGQNRRKANKNNRTGSIGVVPHGERFQVNVWLAGKQHYIGTYSTLKLAKKAHKDAKRELHPGCTI
jgi:hypothetical protein